MEGRLVSQTPMRYSCTASFAWDIEDQHAGDATQVGSRGMSSNTVVGFKKNRRAILQ